MRVAQLVIRGFRGIREATIDFDDHTVLVGPNSTGKTTVIEALALVLGRDRMVRHLTEHDFYGSDPNARDRISLVATLVDFPDNDPSHNADWFRDGRAVPKWWNQAARLAEAQRSPQANVLCAQIAFAARFDRETLSVESKRYFYDSDDMGDPFDEETVTAVPARLIAEIGFFLMPAYRTWDRTISFGSELFSRVVSTLGSVPAEELLDERDRLRNPDTPIESVGELGTFVDNINSELSRLFPNAPSLHFRVTATDTDSLLDALVPHFRYPGSVTLPAGRHGSGLLSLQTMLLLMELGRFRHDQGKSFLLAIEEPELHLPPGLQRRLLYRLQSVSSQTITTSHSPGVASFYPATKVRVLENDAGHMSAKPLLAQPLNAAAPNSLRKLMRDNRYDLIAALMQERVLIPEGRIDFEWLRLLSGITETREGWEAVDRGDVVAFGATVGVIPTHDASIYPTYEVLSSVRSKIAVLVDGDSDGNHYIDVLLARNRVPSVIIQWPDGWTIEDVVVWILGGDPGVLANVNTVLGKQLTLEELRTELKRERPGLKGDYLAYENIAGAASEFSGCLERARQVLDALRAGCVSPRSAHPNLTPDRRTTEACPVLRWHP